MHYLRKTLCVCILLGGSSLSRQNAFVFSHGHPLASQKASSKSGGSRRFFSIVNMDFFFPQYFPQFLFFVSRTHDPPKFLFSFDTPTPTPTPLDLDTCSGVLAHNGDIGWQRRLGHCFSVHVLVWNGISRCAQATFIARVITCIVLQMHKLWLPYPENKEKKTYSLNMRFMLTVLL